MAVRKFNPARLTINTIEAMAISGWGRSTIQKLLQDGTIKHQKINRRVLIDRKAFEALILGTGDAA